MNQPACGFSDLGRLRDFSSGSASLSKRTLHFIANQASFPTALWLGSPAYASMTYGYNLYKNGQFIGTHIKVLVNSREEAQRKAEERLRADLKDRADSVQCKKAETVPDACAA